jgi:hypothetical protein
MILIREAIPGASLMGRHVVLLRLDVDVGGPVPQALVDQQVHDLDHGRVLGDARADLGTGADRAVVLLLERLDVFGDAGQHAVALLDGLLQLPLGRELKVDLVTGHDAQLAKLLQVVGVGCRDNEGVTVDFEREHIIAPRVVLGDQLERRVVAGDLAQVDYRDGELFTEELGQLALID